MKKTAVQLATNLLRLRRRELDHKNGVKTLDKLLALLGEKQSMTALEIAKDMVRLIEEMNRNGFNFYNKTLRQLRVLHEEMVAEVKEPPQEREARDLERWEKIKAIMDHINRETAMQCEDEYRFVLAQILLHTAMKLNYSVQTPVLANDLGMKTRIETAEMPATVEMPPENCA